MVVSSWLTRRPGQSPHPLTALAWSSISDTQWSKIKNPLESSVITANLLISLSPPFCPSPSEDKQEALILIKIIIYRVRNWRWSMNLILSRILVLQEFSVTNLCAEVDKEGGGGPQFKAWLIPSMTGRPGTHLQYNNSGNNRIIHMQMPGYFAVLYFMLEVRANH